MHPAPERMCAACHTRRPKEELWRVVRSPEGVAVMDTTGKAQGRGVYLCHNDACLKKARKSRALEKALGTAVPGAVYDEISRLIEETNG
jgi:Predicted nucleic-acid-binding protein implicated in transcription termination